MNRDPAALTLLTEHQNKIIAIMEGAERILLSGSPSDAYRLSQARWELLRAVTNYQYHKHHLVLDPLITRGDPEQARIATDLKARCLRVGNEFRSYVTRWGERGVCDWATYKPEALALIKTVRSHLSAEAKALRDLIRAAPSGVSLVLA